MGKVKRTPIVINNHAVAVVHIFTRHDHFEDMWMSEIEDCEIETYGQQEKAAEQFIAQLEDQWSITCMKALRDAADKRIIEFEKGK